MGVPRCDLCDSDAVIYIRSTQRHLCRRHFEEFVIERVKREIKEQIKINKGTIAVGLSGGKDSSVLLYLLHKLVDKSIRIVAITVDEGIEGYRKETIKAASQLTRQLGVEHRIVRFSDVFGITLDDVMDIEDKLKPCTYCGIWRRKALNIEARKMNADYLAIGTNLDDYAQTILMNILSDDISKLAKLAPHSKSIKNYVPRIVPLRFISEKEVLIYAILKGIPHDSRECPYAPYALRNEFRRIISMLENEAPGTREKIVQFYLELKDKLQNTEQKNEYRECVKCGESTTGTLCKSCLLLERVKSLSA